MQSSVNWALLGLVIERPSYAYELAQRFERTYGSVLSLSSVSHIYTALQALVGRSLIEELPGTRVGRQPKPRYRATAEGLEGYGHWLVAQVGEDRRRQGLFVLALATFTQNPRAALEVLARYEQACLAEAAKTQVLPPVHSRCESAFGLPARLVNEENRLTLGAKLEWVRYARRELGALVDSRGAGREPA
jgi:DNA-binding PadR family transcriptional regulator